MKYRGCNLPEECGKVLYTFQYIKAKLWGLLLVILLVVCLPFFIMSQMQDGLNTYVLISVFVELILITLLLIYIKRDPTDKGLLILDSGIFSKRLPLGNKYNFIPWGDIRELRMEDVRIHHVTTTYFVINLYDVDKYFARLTRMQKIFYGADKKIFGSHIIINTRSLAGVKPEDVFRIMKLQFATWCNNKY